MAILIIVTITAIAENPAQWYYRLTHAGRRSKLDVCVHASFFFQVCPQTLWKDGLVFILVRWGGNFMTVNYCLISKTYLSIETKLNTTLVLNGWVFK